MTEEEQQRLQIYLQEYDKLKEEQTQRIGFRDGMIYTTLGAFGALLAFVVTNNLNYYALLIAPWLCVILGWTYLVNDEKISAIGRYIRDILSKKITAIVPEPTLTENNPANNQSNQNNDDSETIFGWEIFHRSDDRRIRRKYEQLIIDEITFVFSGLTALFYFWFSVDNAHIAIHILCGLELILLLFLAVEIIIYADIKKVLLVTIIKDNKFCYRDYGGF